jgi:DNA primase
LYGWARLQGVRRTPLLTESATDFLTLSGWGYMPLSSLGTGLKDDHIELLKTLPRLAAVPHNDEAGWEAMRRWQESLPNLIVVSLPSQYKDVNEMAQQRADAREAFDALLPRPR